MALARGSQRLALAVRALCKIIGNNPDVVNPDANPLRRAVYDSVVLACDLFDEFIPPRTPTGALAYTALSTTYTDGVSLPTNFDRSAGKYIVRAHLGAGSDVFFGIRMDKNGVDEFTDESPTALLSDIGTSWTTLGQALANMFIFGANLDLVDIKRNVQGHLVDMGIGGGSFSTYTSAQPAGPEAPYVVTTITYKDAEGNQDRIQLPATYLPLGKLRVAGDTGSSVALTKLVGELATINGNVATRRGHIEFGGVMSVSTISNEKLYRKFFA